MPARHVAPVVALKPPCSAGACAEPREGHGAVITAALVTQQRSDHGGVAVARAQHSVHIAVGLREKARKKSETGDLMNVCLGRLCGGCDENHVCYFRPADACDGHRDRDGCLRT